MIKDLVIEYQAGASSGIGEACAWRFAEAGCKLILLARRADRLDALEKELKEEYDVLIHCVVLDVQNIDAIAALPERLPQGKMILEWW